jgi:hypothetical protein
MYMILTVCFRVPEACVRCMRCATGILRNHTSDCERQCGEIKKINSIKSEHKQKLLVSLL